MGEIIIENWLTFTRGEEWQGICDLIYGPQGLYLDKFFNESVRKEARANLAALKELWLEIREDILAVRDQYAPKREPWGCQFDRKATEPEEETCPAECLAIERAPLRITTLNEKL